MDAQEALGKALSHHGVRGMRWGVRRDGRVGVSKSKGHEVPASEDAKKANTYHDRAHKHGPASLSNQELQHLVTRMNLEQQYSRLQPPSGKQKAAKLVSDILVNVGKQQASKALSDLASQQISRQMKR